MDLKEKIEEALRSSIHSESIRLEDDDGISGFVVSSAFRGLSAIERQTLIDQALRDRSAGLTGRNYRQILVIAALTPAEYEVRGPGRESSRR